MPICDCELHSQSEAEGSPGLVADAEVIVRMIFAPECVNADGSLKNTAIPISELNRPDPYGAPPRGHSVDRADYISLEEMLANAMQRRARLPEERKQAWSFNWLTSDIRGLVVSDGHRAVCVVDRATDGNRAHAEVWGGQTRDRPLMKEVRDLLVQKINNGGLVWAEPANPIG